VIRPKVKGKIICGRRAAGISLPQQLPQFVREHPELEVCYPATINVELTSKIKKIRPDFEMSIYWEWNGHPVYEKFSFTKVKFVYGGSQKKKVCDAWIYDAHGSPHHYNSFLLEIIAPPIKLECTACEIYLPK